jgi:prenylcysteine oxidase / farnesylcysteine lyase
LSNTWSGAGAAGSSTAYFLREFGKEAPQNINITIFEKTDRIGGRTLTIEPFGNASQRAELGASIFIQKNEILYDSLAEFNLTARDPDEGSDPLLGIWDGDEFVFTINTGHSYWWNAYKVFMKYGYNAPRRTQKLMETTIQKFLMLYKSPFFPFRSLTQRIYELGLVEVTALTGEQFLAKNSVLGPITYQDPTNTSWQIADIWCICPWYCSG